MISKLSILALCAPLLSVIGCSDDDGANVRRNAPPGEGGSAGAEQGGAAGEGAGQGGTSGSSGRGGTGGSPGCSSAPDAGLDAGLADGGVSDAGVFDAGDPDASADGGISGLVSFARDIHPIFEVKCNPCHVIDGYAGQNVGGELGQAYIDAVTLGPELLIRIDGGGMPPPDAPPPNDCNGDPGTPGCLSVEEVALVATWIAECNPR